MITDVGINWLLKTSSNNFYMGTRDKIITKTYKTLKNMQSLAFKVLFHLIILQIFQRQQLFLRKIRYQALQIKILLLLSKHRKNKLH